MHAWARSLADRTRAREVVWSAVDNTAVRHVRCGSDAVHVHAHLPSFCNRTTLSSTLRTSLLYSETKNLLRSNKIYYSLFQSYLLSLRHCNFFLVVGPHLNDDAVPIHCDILNKVSMLLYRTKGAPIQCWCPHASFLFGCWNTVVLYKTGMDIQQQKMAHLTLT